MQPISIAPFPPENNFSRFLPVNDCLSGLSPQEEKIRNSFFRGERGVLKPVAPFFPRFFSTGRKRGQAIWSAPKTFICGGRGEAHLPPFRCLLLLPAASVHIHGGARDCHPVGNTGSGGRLATGGCRGADTVASVVPSSSGSYSSSPSSLKPHFCAVAAVAFGPCPAPSCRHCYRLVDCRFVRVANATLSASYSSPSLLRPHFVAVAAVAFGHCPAPSHHHCHCYCLVDCWMPIPHHQRHIRHCCCWGPIFAPSTPPPHPADCRLHAAFLVGDHSSRDTAQARGPLEGAPAALVVGHNATDDDDVHSPLRQSLCMMLQNRGYQFGSKGLLAQKRNGSAAQNGTNTKPAQTGTNRHKLEHLFVLRRGEAHLPPFPAGEQHISEKNCFCFHQGFVLR